LLKIYFIENKGNLDQNTKKFLKISNILI